MDYYSQISIAANWEESLDVIARMIARDRLDLADYEKKDDHNKKAVQVRKEKMERLEQFVRLTITLIDTQATLLEKANSAGSSLNRLYTRYQRLEQYAISKGCDMSLFDLMTDRDFGINPLNLKKSGLL
jgi:hypothetical protein